MLGAPFLEPASNYCSVAALHLSCVLSMVSWYHIRAAPWTFEPSLPYDALPVLSPYDVRAAPKLHPIVYKLEMLAH